MSGATAGAGRTECLGYSFGGPLQSLDRRGICMTVATISKPGLCLIAILVAVLWAFVVTNRLIVRRAQLEASHTIEDTKSRHGVRRSKKPSLRQALVKRIGTV